MTPAERVLAYFDRISEAPDAIPRLRRFVLELAVRGKLTERQTDDESVAELWRELQSQRNGQPVAAQARRRPVQSSEPEESGPFAVPEHWRWGRLEQLASFSAGRTPSRHESSFWNTGEHAWVSIGDMLDGQVLMTTKESVSAKAQELVFGSEPEPAGTMLMSFKLTIGKVARLGTPAFHNEAIVSIRPFVTGMDPYLFKVLPQFARRGATKGAIKGATLNRESISNILVPVPPLPEQQRIVAKVDELMALCGQLEAAQKEREGRRDRLVGASLARLIQQADSASIRKHAQSVLERLPRMFLAPAHVDRLRQAILELAIRGRLVEGKTNDQPASSIVDYISERRRALHREGAVPRPKFLPPLEETEKPFLLPERWLWARLGDLCYKVADGPHFSPNYVSHTEGIPFLSTRNVRRTGFDLSSLKYVSRADHDEFCKRIRPEAGDIIYTKGGTTGIAKVNDLDFEFSVWVHLAVLRIEKEKLFPRYVELALNSPHCYEQSQTYTQGISNFDLGLTRMVKITIPVPPLDEQRKIVAAVDELMSLCSRLEAQLEAGRAAQAALLEATLREALVDRPVPAATS
jgi:type I restriction enzyme S subunit